MRCGKDFYDQPCEDLSKALLGCVLVKVCGDEEYRSIVVETEAYLGAEDKAAHSYKGRKTDRNTAMFMDPGTVYVYSIYGMHHCFNISSRGEGCAVLVRAVEPVDGVEGMRRRREAARRDQDLCNGPAKLCKAMAIDKSCNKLDLVSDDHIWVEQCGGVSESEIVCSGRVGVGYSEEWATKPLRFYIRDNKCVSKK